MKQVRDIVKNVDGWLTNSEGELLYRLAKKCTGRGVIVEIGSWKGKSTIWLAKGSQSGKQVPVYAIDPHTGSKEHQRRGSKVWTFDEFRHNIESAQVKQFVKPLVMESVKAAKLVKEPVELVFIDGAHDYASVKADFKAWYPKLVSGGIIAFHDSITWKGVRQLMEESVFESEHFRDIGLVASITYAQKVSYASVNDRIRNQLAETYSRALALGLLVLLKLPRPLVNFLGELVNKI